MLDTDYERNCLSFAGLQTDGDRGNVLQFSCTSKFSANLLWLHYRAASLTWLTTTQIYYNKESVYI